MRVLLEYSSVSDRRTTAAYPPWAKPAGAAPLGRRGPPSRRVRPAVVVRLHGCACPPARPPAHGPHCAQRAADRCCRSTVGSSSSSCVPKRCRPGPRATAALRGTRTALRTLVALPYGIQPSAARAPSPYPPGEVSVGMCRHARTADCICICARGGGMPVCACRIYGAMAARVSGIVTKFHAMVDHVSYPTACCLVPPLAPEMQVPRAA